MIIDHHRDIILQSNFVLLTEVSTVEAFVYVEAMRSEPSLTETLITLLALRNEYDLEVQLV